VKGDEDWRFAWGSLPKERSPAGSSPAFPEGRLGTGLGSRLRRFNAEEELPNPADPEPNSGTGKMLTAER
jgi:hypothetical protein